MAHRERRTATNQTVEASQAELAVIEGAKNTAQDAVLSIAANKKQLEADFETAKKKMDEELTLKREQATAEIRKLDETIAAKKAEVNAATQVATIVIEETKQLETTRDIVQKQLTESNEKLSAANTEVSRLAVLQHNLNDSVKDIRGDYKDAETKLIGVNKELSEVTAKVTELAGSHDRLLSSVTVYKSDISKFEEITKSYSVAHKKLDSEIQTKIAQKATLDTEVIEVQKQVSQHKQDMAARDAESTTRAGNAARLEQHVDAKLKHLKELEKAFTTEHLARGGYKATE